MPNKQVDGAIWLLDLWAGSELNRSQSRKFNSWNETVQSRIDHVRQFLSLIYGVGQPRTSACPLLLFFRKWKNFIKN